MTSQNNNFIQRNWRSASAVIYLLVNLFDFIIFPSVSWWWSNYSKTPYIPWNPLTLQGAGFFHISFGALLTATSWSKSKEKIAEAGSTNSDSTQ